MHTYFLSAPFCRTRCSAAGYDLSFLIINDHVEVMMRHKLIDFVINFMQEIDKVCPFWLCAVCLCGLLVHTVSRIQKGCKLQ